jgi:hypothetical protein
LSPSKIQAGGRVWMIPRNHLSSLRWLIRVALRAVPFIPVLSSRGEDLGRNADPRILIGNQRSMMFQIDQIDYSDANSGKLHSKRRTLPMGNENRFKWLLQCLYESQAPTLSCCHLTLPLIRFINHTPHCQLHVEAMPRPTSHCVFTTLVFGQNPVS